MPEETVLVEVDCRCPGCGTFSIEAIRIPVDAPAPLQIEQLCRWCRLGEIDGTGR